MLCGELYEIACALIMEDRECAAGGAFEGFAPGIINSFLCENKENAVLLGSISASIPNVSALTDAFPYPDRLISPCVYYLASYMIRDENAAAAEELMARCDRLISDIVSTSCGNPTEGDGEELQVFPGSTVDVYAGVI